MINGQSNDVPHREQWQIEIDLADALKRLQKSREDAEWHEYLARNDRAEEKAALAEVKALRQRLGLSNGELPQIQSYDSVSSSEAVSLHHDVVQGRESDPGSNTEASRTRPGKPSQGA